MSHDQEPVAVPPEDIRVKSLAQASGTLGDGIEHRLHIGRRARNDPENLRGCRLLLQGLAHLGVGLRERTILLLQFCKEPHVLDGDNGLIGEGLEQRDLLVSELPRFLASGNSSASLCRSATWTVRPSMTDRLTAIPRPSGRENSPTGPPIRIGP